MAGPIERTPENVSRSIATSLLYAGQGHSLFVNGSLGAITPRTIEVVPMNLVSQPEPDKKRMFQGLRKMTNDRKAQNASNLISINIAFMKTSSIFISRFFYDALHRICQGPLSYAGKIGIVSAALGVNPYRLTNFSNASGCIVEGINVFKRIHKLVLSNKDRAAMLVCIDESRSLIREMIENPNFKYKNDFTKFDSMSNLEILQNLQEYEIYLKEVYAPNYFEFNSLEKLRKLLIDNNLDDPLLNKIRFSQILTLKDLDEISKFAPLNDIELYNALEAFKKEFLERKDLLIIQHFKTSISIHEMNISNIVKSTVLSITSSIRCIGFGIAYGNVPLGLTIWVSGYLLEFILSIPSYLFSGFNLLGVLEVKGIRDRARYKQKIFQADLILKNLATEASPQTIINTDDTKRKFQEILLNLATKMSRNTEQNIGMIDTIKFYFKKFIEIIAKKSNLNDKIHVTGIDNAINFVKNNPEAKIALIDAVLNSQDEYISSNKHTIFSTLNSESLNSLKSDILWFWLPIKTLSPLVWYSKDNSTLRNDEVADFLIEKLLLCPPLAEEQKEDKVPLQEIVQVPNVQSYSEAELSEDTFETNITFLKTDEYIKALAIPSEELDKFYDLRNKYNESRKKLKEAILDAKTRFLATEIKNSSENRTISRNEINKFKEVKKYRKQTKHWRNKYNASRESLKKSFKDTLNNTAYSFLYQDPLFR